MARRNIKIDLRLSEQEMERLRRDVARSGWSPGVDRAQHHQGNALYGPRCGAPQSPADQ